MRFKARSFGFDMLHRGTGRNDFCMGWSDDRTYPTDSRKIKIYIRGFNKSLPTTY